MKTFWKLWLCGLVITILLIAAIWPSNPLNYYRSSSAGPSSYSPVEAVIDMLLPQNTHIYPCFQIPFKHGTYSDEYMGKRRAFDKAVELATGQRMEGNSGDTIMQSQYRFYYQLAKLPWVRTICETGFNAGHDAFQWLAASSDSTVLHSFDLCTHDYTPKMVQYIHRNFPGRLYMKCGDSTETLPLASHLHGQCDVIIVDGGHTYQEAKADLVNFRPLANPQHHLVVIDDVPENNPVTKAWGKVKGQGLVRELFSCRMMPSRGFTVGMYNLTQEDMD